MSGSKTKVERQNTTTDVFNTVLKFTIYCYALVIFKYFFKLTRLKLTIQMNKVGTTKLFVQDGANARGCRLPLDTLLSFNKLSV